MQRQLMADPLSQWGYFHISCVLWSLVTPWWCLGVRRRGLIRMRQKGLGLRGGARSGRRDDGGGDSEIVGFAVRCCCPAADGVQVGSRGSIYCWKSNLNIVQVILIRVGISSLKKKQPRNCVYEFNTKKWKHSRFLLHEIWN